MITAHYQKQKNYVSNCVCFSWLAKYPINTGQIPMNISESNYWVYL